MTELHIYRGLQGSGKSTLARSLASVDGGRVVGRDHIRALMGFSGIGKGRQEQEVTIIQGRLIAEGLKAGQNVHVDDMNLKDVYVRRLLGIPQKLNRDIDIVIQDLTDAPLDVCIERDLSRPSPVGADVLRSYHTKFIKGRGYPLPIPTTPLDDMRLQPVQVYVPNTSKPRAVLVDLDGTVALKGDRGYHDYDERVFYDLPNENVIRVIRTLIEVRLTPVFVSGRKGYADCRTATSAWITKHISAGSQWLYMREPHDNRPDWMVKTDIFDKHIRGHWNVIGAFDDRDQVVQRYREMGLTVFQVADGAF